MDHLETKRQILALRAKFGEDNWLSSHPATYIENIMGLQSSGTAANTLLSSTFTDNNDSFRQASLIDTASISPILPAQINLAQSIDNTLELTNCTDQVKLVTHSCELIRV
jgi:hypothetical protein